MTSSGLSITRAKVLLPLLSWAQERRLLQEGIEKFPYFDKLYLMLGQLEERAGSADAARGAYQAGLKRCMGSVPLWRSVARLEEAAGAVGKARALLEQVIFSFCRLLSPTHLVQDTQAPALLEQASPCMHAAAPAPPRLPSARRDSAPDAPGTIDTAVLPLRSRTSS